LLGKGPNSSSRGITSVETNLVFKLLLDKFGHFPDSQEGTEQSSPFWKFQVYFSNEAAMLRSITKPGLGLGEGAGG
jgi:hypothetical protein